LYIYYRADTHETVHRRVCTLDSAGIVCSFHFTKFVTDGKMCIDFVDFHINSFRINLKYLLALKLKEQPMEVANSESDNIK
jgi:hypothetical protein